MVVAIQSAHYPDAARSIPLTPLESAVPICLPSCKQNASITPLESALTSHYHLTENTATLSLAVSALTDFSPVTPLESALTKNIGGGGTLPRTPTLETASHPIRDSRLHAIEKEQAAEDHESDHGARSEKD